MAGDIIIERLDLDGFLRGLHPLLQQGIIALIFLFVSTTRLHFFVTFGAYILGIFLIADIIISKTVGWEKLLEG